MDVNELATAITEIRRMRKEYDRLNAQALGLRESIERLAQKNGLKLFRVIDGGEEGITVTSRSVPTNVHVSTWLGYWGAWGMPFPVPIPKDPPGGKEGCGATCEQARAWAEQKGGGCRVTECREDENGCLLEASYSLECYRKPGGDPGGTVVVLSPSEGEWGY
jgi:hypothetical protein